MTIKAGQNIRFDVKISGEPPPSKSWFLNKARLDSKDDVSIDNEDYKTKLVIMPVSRKHSGIYVIKAENSCGKDEVAVEVTVLGMLKTTVATTTPSTVIIIVVVIIIIIIIIIIVIVIVVVMIIIITTTVSSRM
jgi:hypothetical protein